jgi:protein TonB
MSTVKVLVSIIASLGINYYIFVSLNQDDNTIWELSQSQVVPQQIDPSLLESIQILTEKKPVQKEKPVEIKKEIIEPTPQKLVKEEKVEEEPIEKEVKKQANLQKVIPVQTSAKIISKAKYKNPPPLQYPDQAIKQGLFGQVKIKAKILENGQVAKVEIIESSGSMLLDNAAIEWFKDIEFFPAQSESGAVSSSVTQTISFKLEDVV